MRWNRRRRRCDPRMSAHGAAVLPGGPLQRVVECIVEWSGELRAPTRRGQLGDLRAVVQARLQDAVGDGEVELAWGGQPLECFPNRRPEDAEHLGEPALAGKALAGSHF